MYKHFEKDPKGEEKQVIKGLEKWLLHDCTASETDLQKALVLIERLQSENAGYEKLKLFNLAMANGELDMSISGEYATAFFNAIIEIFDQNGGKNFFTTTLDIEGRKGRYAFTIEKVGGQTVAEKLAEQKAQIERLTEREKFLENAWNVARECTETVEKGLKASEARNAELQKQVDELREELKNLEWYKMWHKKFKKEIDDLTLELETYRPTKLSGNGQCKCSNCGRVSWTDWFSRYKGQTLCDKCLKEIIATEEKPQAVKDTAKEILQELWNEMGEYKLIGIDKFEKTIANLEKRYGVEVE